MTFLLSTAIFTPTKLIVGFLCVSLAILLLLIGYRKLLAYFGRGGGPAKEDFCVLYSIEENPVIGEVSFYFTAHEPKEVAIQIFDENHDLVKEVSKSECTTGGNIIRFVSNELPNGNYYYGLITKNQKTVKKMRISN
jgi:hypothetical protein